MPVNDIIQFRRGDFTEWASANPILASGEPGFDNTNNILKIGDGLNIWSDRPLIPTSDIYVYAKNATSGTLYKGQVVYINGALGSNPTLSLAIASSESTSTKTLGLLKQDLAVNDFGYVVSEGILDGIDTDEATSEGDPMWLSPTVSGGIIYGLVNKPLAPNHLVFLGYVLRKQQNNGRVYVKVQNGYELEELHNVATTGATNGQFLQYNSFSGLWIPSSSGNFSTLQVNGTGVSISGHKHIVDDITDFSNGVSNEVDTILSAGTGISLNYDVLNDTLSINSICPTGIGISNYNTRWVNSNTLGTGIIYDNGTNVGIGTSSPSALLNVESGNIVFNDLGGDYDFRVEGDSDSNLLFVDASNDTVNIGTGSSTGSKLYISSSNSREYAYILASGGVGSESSLVRISNSNNSNANSFAGLFISTTRQSSAVAQGAVIACVSTNASAYTPDIVFAGRNGGSTYAEFVRINRDGNLGIGTSSPSYKLDVVGTGNFSQNLLVNGTGVTLSGHTHSSSDITNFNSSVSGLLPVKNIIAGTDINVSNNNGEYTITSTAAGGGSSDAIHIFLLGGM